MNYRDKFYSKYISSHTAHLYSEPTLTEIKRQFPILQRYFWKFLPKDKDVKIIDLGCGYGGLVYWLQEFGYSNIEGIDVSIEQVEAAKKLGIKNINQADFRDFLKNKKDFYDIIFMRDILEHFTKNEILDVLEIVYKSLRNNGVIIIQVPNAKNLFSGRLRYGDFTHEVSFTEHSIKQVLSVSGFKSVSIKGTYPIVHGVKSLIRFILWKIIELFIRCYFLIESGTGKGIFSQNLIAAARK